MSAEIEEIQADDGIELPDASELMDFDLESDDAVVELDDASNVETTESVPPSGKRARRPGFDSLTDSPLH